MQLPSSQTAVRKSSRAPWTGGRTARTHSNFLVGKGFNIDASPHRFKQRPKSLDSHKQARLKPSKQARAPASRNSAEVLCSDQCGYLHSLRDSAGNTRTSLGDCHLPAISLTSFLGSESLLDRSTGRSKHDWGVDIWCHLLSEDRDMLWWHWGKRNVSVLLLLPCRKLQRASCTGRFLTVHRNLWCAGTYS